MAAALDLSDGQESESDLMNEGSGSEEEEEESGAEGSEFEVEDEMKSRILQGMIYAAQGLKSASPNSDSRPPYVATHTTSDAHSSASLQQRNKRLKLEHEVALALADSTPHPNPSLKNLTSGLTPTFDSFFGAPGGSPAHHAKLVALHNARKHSQSQTSNIKSDPIYGSGVSSFMDDMNQYQKTRMGSGSSGGSAPAEESGSLAQDDSLDIKPPRAEAARSPPPPVFSFIAQDPTLESDSSKSARDALFMMAGSGAEKWAAAGDDEASDGGISDGDPPSEGDMGVDE